MESNLEFYHGPPEFSADPSLGMQHYWLGGMACGPGGYWVSGQIVLVMGTRGLGRGCTGGRVIPGATRGIRNLVVRYRRRGKVCDGRRGRSTKGDFFHGP